MVVKFTMSLPKAMEEELRREMEARRLGSLQETIRSILAEYFRSRSRPAQPAGRKD